MHMFNRLGSSLFSEIRLYVALFFVALPLEAAHNVALDFGSVSATTDSGAVLLLNSPASSSPVAVVNIKWLAEPAPTSGELKLTIDRGADKINILDANGAPLTVFTWNADYPSSFQIRAKEIS